jgi:uncharacterized membrane protein YjjP (DUF1212 family)
VTEEDVFKAFTRGDIDFDELQSRLNNIETYDRRLDLAALWVVALAGIVFLAYVFQATP